MLAFISTEPLKIMLPVHSTDNIFTRDCVPLYIYDSPGELTAVAK